MRPGAMDNASPRDFLEEGERGIFFRNKPFYDSLVVGKFGEKKEVKRKTHN
jgi:hypothetical protein